MKNLIPKDWQEILKAEFTKDYFYKLEKFIENQYISATIYPKKEKLFYALKLCSFQNTKVVILGQDPYHNVNQAHGLAFSVADGVKIPPSLRNIYKELHHDCAFEIPKTGNLTKWAEQGVLLLNAVLSVEAHKPNSHKSKGWEQFTDAIITEISTKKENVVFLLWGNYAKEKGKNIDKKKHFILESCHPSPFSANRNNCWFGKKQFSQTNAYLKRKNRAIIQW